MYDERTTKMEKRKNSYEFELAGVFERFFAILIDSLITSVAVGVLIVGGGSSAGFLGTLIVGAYNWYFWTRNHGQTPGKAIMGIRIIKADGTPLNDVEAILRYIGYHISGFFFGLGYLWAFWDPNRQTWHDKIVNTYVVKAKPVTNYDYEKRKVDQNYDYDSTIL